MARGVRYAIRTLAPVVLGLGAAAVQGVLPTPATAAMALNKVILDFQPGQPRRTDVEVRNTGKERMYVVVEPTEIRQPGTKQEKRVKVRDPQDLGLLVTPSRLILEPGQRKIVRFAALAGHSQTDRIYRVTIRPAVGRIKSKRTAVKIVVGYDLLVMLRPRNPKPNLVTKRTGRTVTFQNTGNTNALLFNGRQCDKSGKKCKTLPVKRLYANATWKLKLDRDTPVEYYIRSGRTTQKKTF